MVKVYYIISSVLITQIPSDLLMNVLNFLKIYITVITYFTAIVLLPYYLVVFRGHGIQSNNPSDTIKFIIEYAEVF